MESNNLEKVSLEYMLIFGEPLDCRGPMDMNDEALLDNPIGEFLAKCLDEHSLAKNGGVDSSWSQEIGVAPRMKLSQEFLRRSDERMQRVTETLKKIFHGHDEELAEAVALAEQLRKDIREEFAA
jgi:hypothetical protein